MTTEKNLLLSIHTGPGSDAEELSQLTRELQEELLELDVERVDLVKDGEIPDKAKAGDPISLGTLLLTLAASGGVITTMIKLVQSWIVQSHIKSVSMEMDGDKLEVTGISSEDQARLIKSWISRHSGED